MCPAREPETYVYFDGDDVGAAVELCLIDDDPEGAAAVSARVSDAIESLARALREDLGAVVYYAAGDEVLARLRRPVFKSDLERLRKNFYGTAELSLSCGVGGTPSEATLRLRVAKLRGKNQAQGVPGG